jgi:hypothetical protein
MPQFEIEVGGNIAPITKNLTDLKARLRELKFDIEKSTDAAAITLLNKELKQTEQEIKRIRSIGPIIPDSVKKGADQATFAVTNFSRVIQDAPFGFLGIANNLNPLLESFQRLRAETGSNKAALQSLGSSLLGAGGLGLAVSVASSLLLVFSDRLFKTSKESDNLKKKADALNSAINSAFSSTAKEVAQVDTLVAVLRNETETRERKLGVVKQLQSISPEVFKNLKLEGDAVTGLDAAYKAFLANLENVVAVRILQAKLEALIEQRLKKQGANLVGADALGTLKSAREQLEALRKIQQGGGIVDPAQIALLEGQIKSTEASLSTLDKQINAIMENITSLSSGVKVNTGSTKKEEDALKKRLDLLEKIKKATLDPSELVGIQEAIFDIQLKIANRDDKKRLSGTEFDQLVKGFQKELNDAFKNQALSLEAIPKVKFSPVAFAEIPKQITDVVSKATGNEKITITLHDVRVKFLGNKKTKILEGTEAINQQLSEDINASLENLQLDLSSTLGESLGEAFANAIQGGDIADGLKNAAKAMLGILGSTMQQIGRYVIGAAIKIQTLKKVLSTWAIKNPALAVIAGIGLIAAGAALKNATFEGPKFAKGGIVTGPTIGMVGEAGKEAIIPLNKLGSMIGNPGGTTVVLKGSLGIRGREIVAFLEQEQTRFNRIR